MGATCAWTRAYSDAIESPLHVRILRLLMVECPQERLHQVNVKSDMCVPAIHSSRQLVLQLGPQRLRELWWLRHGVIVRTDCDAGRGKCRRIKTFMAERSIQRVVRSGLLLQTGARARHSREP